MKPLHLFLFALLTTSINSIAQEPAKAGLYLDGVYNANRDAHDGVYDKENIGGRRPIQYPYLREADVAWEKRVWREIDMREKQNFPLYFPVENVRGRESLFQVLTKHILNGDIRAFADEEFLMPYELSAIRKKLVVTDTIDGFIYDEKGNEIPVRTPVADSTSIYRQVLKYRVKEDWYFDKQRSCIESRIIGLAAYQYDEEKEGYKELFWVYFPSCRPYFAASDVYNVKNDSERRSFDDIFWKHQYASRIIKESNVYDRYINEYEKGIDALIESDKIKNTMFNWESDLWHF
ncbi:MAG: gliding motility protein GldN [Bacteroidetes bacterium]|nr:gliding motility protein GldN [Bacteroidota bacterium]